MDRTYPERLVCLTDETTETLYLLGEDSRIVGISSLTVRPPQARRDKPRIATFTSARLEDIVALSPDLVLGFSDLQADVAAELIRRGIEVHVFNQRSVAGILRMIQVLGGMIGRADRAAVLLARLEQGLEVVRARARHFRKRPRVYFEEWDEPMISGIFWVSELIAIAGGDDCFPELAEKPLARDRIIYDIHEVVRRSPDIIIGSWCGKPFRPEAVVSRAGWNRVPAVQNGAVFGLDSSIILQPGPAALTDGITALHEIFAEWDRRFASVG